MSSRRDALDQPTPPPTKASLRAWWNHFTKKEGEKAELEVHPVFGKPLKESLKYASVQISTANANGELYVWGRIPVVVAKCGLFLKENATETEGVFRVSGSNKRMRELQAAFETPPRYGRNLEWSKEFYTPHDVASVFRRYLTQMPEPVIPHDLYHGFRDVLIKPNISQEEIVSTYKRLIRTMPPHNQYLLLYVLDLLSVFARKCDKNLMTSTNLAVIFRPGLIAHPSHEMSPKEHALSQRVLEFLIAQQDWFMLDIPPPPEHIVGGPETRMADYEDIAVFSSSDEEKAPATGWKLVAKQSSLQRRKTTYDRGGQIAEVSPTPSSPASNTTPSRQGSMGSQGVSRSRTLPSGKRGTADLDESQRTRVLRKKRAVSSQSEHRNSVNLPGGTVIPGMSDTLSGTTAVHPSTLSAS